MHFINDLGEQRVHDDVDGLAVGEVVLVAFREACVHDVRDVVQHHAKVRHGQCRQDEVGRPAHLFRRQHANVHHVRQRPEDAHRHADVPVDRVVIIRKLLQAAVRVIRTVVHVSSASPTLYKFKKLQKSAYILVSQQSGCVIIASAQSFRSD